MPSLILNHILEADKRCVNPKTSGEAPGSIL